MLYFLLLGSRESYTGILFRGFLRGILKKSQDGYGKLLEGNGQREIFRQVRPMNGEKDKMLES